ncbi:MAG: hypothetical protein ACQKBV_13060 [Puniceicoccales bacterium]
MITKLKKLFGKGEEADPAPDEVAEESTDNDAEASTGEDGERVYSRDEKDSRAWIGVGLDGALAMRSGDGFTGEIGEPVPNMVVRVKDWVKHKRLRVRILTPRAATEEGAAQVEAWLKKHKLDWLDFTHAKDLHMVEFWDDRAVQVISNTGTKVGDSPNGLDPDPEAQATGGPPVPGAFPPGPPPPGAMPPPPGGR